MKANPRCDHVDGDRRCPDSAGYRILQNYHQLRPGQFCRKHVKVVRTRHDRVVPLDRLRPEDR